MRYMTARFAELLHDLGRNIADEILDLPGVAAVGYDITHKPLVHRGRSGMPYRLRGLPV